MSGRFWTRRVWQLGLGGLGLGLGLALSACPGPPGSESECTSLCQSAYACGVIPSALGNGITSSDEETVVSSCIERCRSSDATRNDVAVVKECLGKYLPTDAVDVCAPECRQVVSCLRSAVSTGDIGAESLGTANVTVTMVPADLWLSTKENATWCPEGIGEVPLLREYYGNEEIVTAMTALLTKASASYDALEAGLDAAVDEQARLDVLNEMETAVFGGTYLLPGALVSTLRAEIMANGWATPSVVDGDLVPGGCIRQLIDDTRDTLLDGIDLADPASIRARIEQEVAGENAFEVFSSGFSVCQQNSDYIGVSGAKECEQVLTGTDKCRVFGKPLCSIGDCDGGLAGCDPLMCFFEQHPPSRACSDLGIDEVYLGYERDGSKFIEQQPRVCDGAVIDAYFPDVTISVVTPFAVVRGELKSAGEIPGQEALRCGSSAGAPAPGPSEELVAEATAPTPAAVAARDGDVDPFRDPAPGSYCWVVHGEATQVVAGERALVVPSPFVEFLKQAIKPASRFGLLAPQLPIGCACELDPSRCENLANGNCRDGKDNDGDGLTDYYAPECAGFVDTLPYYAPPAAVNASDVDGCGDASSSSSGSSSSTGS